MALQHDIGPHRAMWRNFVKIVAFSAAAAGIVLALMALFLL